MSINGDSRGPVAFVKGVDLSTVGDTFIKLDNARVIPRNITITNASTTLAGSSATVGLYTAPAAGGTAIVTPATATGLTSAAAYNDRTIAATGVSIAPTYDSTQKAWGWYIRVGVAHGSAATLDFYVYGDTVAP